MTELTTLDVSAPSSTTITVGSGDVSVQEGTVLSLTGSAGPPGPAGAQGPTGPAGVATSTEIASTTLSGHRVVAFTADGEIEYADNGTSSHLHFFVGVSLNAAATGDPVNIQSYGEIEESSWAWTAGGPVFLGANGLLTQSPPAPPAFIRVVGVAMTTTSLWVRPEPGIVQV